MARNGKRESTFLTEEEIAALLRVPDRRTTQGKRDYALLKTAIGSGLRAAELCGLDVGDVQSYRKQPVLVVNGKGGKLRKVPLHPEALEAIRAYHQAEGRNGADPGEPIFRTLGKHGPYEAGRLTYKAVSCLVSRVVKASLIRRRITPHVLRHTALTSLLYNGADLKTVQEIAGHAKASTTELYIHTNMERKVAAVHSLDFGG